MKEKRHGLTTDKQTPSSQSAWPGLLRIFCAIFSFIKEKSNCAREGKYQKQQQQHCLHEWKEPRCVAGVTAVSCLCGGHPCQHTTQTVIPKATARNTSKVREELYKLSSQLFYEWQQAEATTTTMMETTLYLAVNANEKQMLMKLPPLGSWQFAVSAVGNKQQQRNPGKDCRAIA